MAGDTITSSGEISRPVPQIPFVGLDRLGYGLTHAATLRTQCT